MTDRHKQQLKETLGYKPPAFQFYPDDWLGSSTIAMMLPEQEGAYIRLLAICWGSDRLALTNDQSKLAIMSRIGSRWSELGPLVMSCFEPHPFDGEPWLTNVKLIEVRHNTWLRAIAGSEGGKAKKANLLAKDVAKGIAKGVAKDKQKATLPSFLPSCLPGFQNSSLPPSKKESQPPSAVGLDLATHLREKVLKASPNQAICKLEGSALNRKLGDWGCEMDRIMRLDKRTPKQMMAVIDFAHADNVPRKPGPGHRVGFCWASATLRPAKLRNSDLWGQFDMAKSSGTREYVPRELRGQS